MNLIEVSPVPGPDLREPLRLLEEWLRDGEPVPDEFLREMQHQVNAGHLEVLAAHLGGRMVGVLVLAFRPNVSLGSTFASIEDLYVHPQARRKGVARVLLQAADDRCRNHSICYLEVQVEENAANAFYEASGYEPEPDVRVFSRSLAIQSGADEKPDT
jgi:GNAT superfamily N-acetyltransferase